MAYNMTNLTDADGLFDIIVFINNSHPNVFASLLVICVFFILLLRLSNKGIENALLTSSFLCLILTLILSVIGLVPLIFVLVWVTILIFTGFYLYMKE